MTKELKHETEELYRTFSIYPFKSTMDGCPCCVSNSDKEKIHFRQLRELTEDDLSRYTFKAMTTWGDTDDFKHYLPRIFELMATTDFIVDTFVVLGKLEYATWRTWSKNEQNVIENFLLAWWGDSVKTKSSFNKETFFEIIKLNLEVEGLLERWKIDFNDQSFASYVDFVYNHYNDLTNKVANFKNFDPIICDKLVRWTRANSDKLESGFFRYDSIDKEFAEKISTTVYIVERT